MGIIAISIKEFSSVRLIGGRKGVPKIDNKVWIGINACIVGNVTIGDDVLIAPNSYVNCDVPAHSVVFGNPCVIKHRDNATEDYINNIYNIQCQYLKTKPF